MGGDSFTYKVSDGTLTSGTGTVTLTVVDTAPLAYTNYFTTAAGVAFNSAATPAYGVQYLAYDADGDHLTSQPVAQPAHGTLAMNSDGSFVYTPNNGFSGLDMFTYDDSDGVLTSNVATAYVYVGNQSGISSRGTPQIPTAAEGTLISNDELLSWSFSYGSSSDYTLTIQWGDGTESAGTTVNLGRIFGWVIEGSHTYTAAGSYPVSIAILGDATAQNALAVFNAATTATITDLALSATPLYVQRLHQPGDDQRGRDVHRSRPERQGERLHGDDQLGHRPARERHLDRGRPERRRQVRRVRRRALHRRPAPIRSPCRSRTRGLDGHRQLDCERDGAADYGGQRQSERDRGSGL